MTNHASDVTTDSPLAGKVANELGRARSGEQPDLTLWDVVESCAEMHGSREALVLGEHRSDFVSLRDDAAKVRAGLFEVGVRPGDHVALIGVNTPEWIAAFLGAVALGAKVVPVNTRLTDDEIRWTVEASHARTVLAQPAYASRDLGALIASLAELRNVKRVYTIESRLPGFEPVPRGLHGPPSDVVARPDDIAVVMYTSGSTALPKGCMLDHQGIVRNACLHTARLGITAEDRWFSGMPLFHAGGLIWGLASVLVTGACLVTQEIYDAAEALDLIEREACTYHHGVETMFIREMEHPEFRPERLTSLHSAASTGPPEVLRRIHNVMGISGVVSKWGITEGYGNLTLCAPDDPFDKRIESVGRGYPGIEYRIADVDNGADLPTGSVGEICVRGCAMVGYFDAPDLTAQTFDDDGWLHTGDLGRFDDEGYLYFEGRLKEMVKVGGENVSAREVENALVHHPDVSQAFVVGCLHADLGEVPVAFVVPSADDFDLGELDEHCRQALAAFKVPARYVRVGVEELDLTGSMKVARITLAKRAEEMFGVLQ